MSRRNAEWLYINTNIGVGVEYVGSDQPMTRTNGLGDWNIAFAVYRAGSALS